MTQTTTATRTMTARHVKTAFQISSIKREMARNRVRDFTVELSFPDSALMQNRSNGKHWTFSHQAKVAQHDEAYLLTRQSIVTSGFEAKAGAFYRIEMDFYPPDKRHRDTANIYAAMKAAMDCIAKAMDVDDYYFKDGEQKRFDTELDKVVVRVIEIQ